MFGNEDIRIRTIGLFAFFCLIHPVSPGNSFALREVESASWTAPSEQPEVIRAGDGFSFPCGFSGAEDRFYWDLELENDFTAYDGLWVEFRYENPGSFRAVTLHFESGAGWYATTLPVSEHPQTRFIPFNDFEAQGEPEGWAAISRFRVSPWKGEGKGNASPGLFVLSEARTERTRFLMVEPNESDFSSVEERTYARTLTEALASRFVEMGVPVARLPDAEAAEADLKRFDVLIFPLNPAVSTSLIDALDPYVSGGGKLAVFYSASSALAERAGFRSVKYLSAPRKNHWNVLSFPGESWRGPERVVQTTTDNLMVVPVSGGHRVLAWWEDGFGRRQKEPAVVLSEHALWFTSVLTPENEDAKRKMLAFTLDLLQPETGIARSAVATAFQQARDRAMIPRDRFREEVDSDGTLSDLEARVNELLAEGETARAWDAVDQLSREIDLRIAAATPLPSTGFRGVWDHSGDGITPGTWSGTFSLMSDANLTDYVVFVPRQSPVPSRVVSAAEDSGVGVHAWHICFNLYGVSSSGVRRYERENRLQVNPDGETVSWLCPANERNRNVELRRLKQLAETPGLRGVHLDYVRWRDGVFCICSTCKEAFTRFVGKPVDWPRDALEGRHHSRFLEWRAAVIDSFVESVSSTLRDTPSDVRLSAAVWPAYPDVIHRLGQNWGKWIDKGWLDFVVPMNYTTDSTQFKEWIQHQSTVVPDPGKLVAGIGYRSSESRLTPGQVLEQIRISADAGAGGYVLFQLNPSFQSELVPVLQVSYERGE